VKTSKLFFIALASLLPVQGATLTLVNDFNSTHSLSDVFHLGDNQNDSRFIPPSLFGTSLTLNFALTLADLAGADLAGDPIMLFLDQYQADNTDPALRSFVELNGGTAGFLSFNPLLIDLTGRTTIPVVTDSFSVKPLLRVGQNTLVIHSVFGGADFDDFDVTNVRLTGLGGSVPEPGTGALLVLTLGISGLFRFRRAFASPGPR
jgi:hypothetical protein